MINPLGILQCSVWARVEGRAVRILPRQPLDPASTQLPGTGGGGGGGCLGWGVAEGVFGMGLYRLLARQP